MKKKFRICMWLIMAAIPVQQLLAQGSGKRPPNFIIILADDLGYGDLGCYGHPTIQTPALDQMAREGSRFTQFYVAANVCSPSRGALLTGRLPVRLGITGSMAVFFPHSTSGLPEGETTIAAALRTKGYRTGIVGKWHLGHLPAYLPTNRGFDEYFGIPYSNDMVPDNKAGIPYPPLPLFRNTTVIEENPDQTQLTKRYTEESIAFIKRNKDKPFFLYYPNNAPHVPLYASSGFSGKSTRGSYGDVVTELDWSVGRILQTLKETGLDRNTFVIFLSDNGPWLTQHEAGGTAGLLAEGKGSTYEGGMRVPAITWWPGVIPANTVNPAIVTSMDLFPTLIHWAGLQPESKLPLDGFDQGEVFAGKRKAVRDIVYYYDNDRLYAIRKGPWKAHFTTHPGYAPQAPQPHDPPQLFNLEEDPGEQYNQASAHAALIDEFRSLYQLQFELVKPAPSELNKVSAGPIDDAFKKLIKQRTAQ
ncbi:sulfatase family protein [Flavihumibacter petaseus]|uniref:Putative arylsulfatase n=1 Tax=Flavihumibacter petaseus NBRC 106054 TaxID=1220578 RepID=A0A0E9MWG8_9BACT|nr:sulfatase [Flavihumibacter petaseus]GAO41914.1 putative arylsulfatase [Flavihumibacter petaseus NBRC 106054]